MTALHEELGMPRYGRRLLPCVLDDEARRCPQRIFASLAKSEDISHGFRDVSYLEMASAVNYMAHELQGMFGSKPGRDFETLTYLGVPDLRYNIVVYAAVKCGFKVFLPSPRNSPAVNISLLNQLHCKKILFAPEVEGTVKALTREGSDTRVMAIASCEQLFSQQWSDFPYNPQFEDAVWDPIIVLHSSGSTGLPKPVIMKHGSFTVMDNDRNFPSVPGRKNHDLTVWDFDGFPGRIYEPFPPFHLAGFFNKVMVPLYTNAIPVFGPPLRPPSGKLVVEIMQSQQLRGCILPPSIAEQLYHDPNGLNWIKKLDVFCYAGGPLSEAIGDAISQVTTLCQFYGSTELGQIRQLVPQLQDWSFMEFHPLTSVAFERYDNDTFELIVSAGAEGKDDVALNYNYPGVPNWYTNDLFKPHPSKPNLWRFQGRKDDIIVLSSGEKLNPLPMENQLQTLPFVHGALVVGQGRFQPLLILEVNKTDADSDAMMGIIWAEVESGNAKMPAHGRIARSLIILSVVEKPFVRAGKGTIVRKLTEKAYVREISNAYEASHKQLPPNLRTLEATGFTYEAVSALIRSIILPLLRLQRIEDDANFYTLGLDSLRTVEASGILKSSVLAHRDAAKVPWLSAETFYSYPTLSQLSDVMLRFLNDGVLPDIKDRNKEMASVYERFVGLLPRSSIARQSPIASDNVNIAVTGTTGSLGTHLLKRCLNNTAISRVWCLNRSSNAEAMFKEVCGQDQPDAFSDREKLIFKTVDFTRPDLDMGDQAFSKLCHDLDLIIHVAWKVDFNQSLPSFTDNLQSIQTLAHLSAASPRRPRIVFVSSISSVGPWNKRHELVPESPIDDMRSALEIGYGESKAIAEKMLQTSSEQAGVPITVLRVGQIAGPSTSVHAQWSKRELVPSLLQTSRSIGLIPMNLPPVDWIAVDILADVVLELSISDSQGEVENAKYYHIVNPRGAPWSGFLELFQEFCGNGMKAVPLDLWVQKLQTFNLSDPQELEVKPVLKFLRFFELMALKGPVSRFSTVAALNTSKTMSMLEPVSHNLMEQWLKQSV